MGVAGDSLVGISTSGRSRNVILAMETAKHKGMNWIGLLGGDRGPLLHKCDLAVVIPDSRTARIQEAHVFIIHVRAAFIEQEMVMLNG